MVAVEEVDGVVGGGEEVVASTSTDVGVTDVLEVVLGSGESVEGALVPQPTAKHVVLLSHQTQLSRRRFFMGPRAEQNTERRLVVHAAVGGSDADAPRVDWASVKR